MKKFLVILVIVLNAVVILGCIKKDSGEETKKMTVVEESNHVTQKSVLQEKIEHTYRKADLIKAIQKVIVGFSYEPVQAIVISEGEVIKGRDKWDSFINKIKSGITSDILVKEYYIDEKEADCYSVVSIERRIHYDGKKYTVKESICETKNSNGKKETVNIDSTKKYKYLIERSGRLPNAAVSQHGFYLVDDNNLTFGELEWSVLSSQSTDWIDYLQVFCEYTPYSEFEELEMPTTMPLKTTW